MLSFGPLAFTTLIKSFSLSFLLVLLLRNSVEIRSPNCSTQCSSKNWLLVHILCWHTREALVLSVGGPGRLGGNKVTSVSGSVLHTAQEHMSKPAGSQKERKCMRDELMTFHLQREQQISVSHVLPFLPLHELNAVLILSLHPSRIFHCKYPWISITLPKWPAKSHYHLTLKRNINEQ